MRAYLRVKASASAMLLSTPLLLACAQQTAPGTQVSATTLGELTAQVVAVDKANRQVQLRERDGTVTTLDVPPEVRNFSQIAVGDVVHIEYRARIDLLASDSSVPITGVEVKTTARGSDAGQKPSGILKSRTELAVQIVSVDRATHTVTFREADGSVDSITAVDPANFDAVDGLRPGTKVLVTVTRVIAATVERV